jgi:hypothetical protein
MAEAVQNPWLNISWDNTIADCDKGFKVGRQKYCFDSTEYVDFVNSKDLTSRKNKPVKFTFDCLPEPFSGDVNSKVYCLNKNPGEHDPNFDRDQTLEQYTIKCLSHKLNGTIWTDKLINSNGELHGGTKWLRSKTAELRKDLGLGDKNPNLFFIDYFPYHSSHGFTFPKELPSNSYRNYLVEKAMEEEKIIIIMRERQRWFDAIKNLESYGKLITLRCAAGGWLSKNNMDFANNCRYDDLLDALK